MKKKTQQQSKTLTLAPGRGKPEDGGKVGTSTLGAYVVNNNPVSTVTYVKEDFSAIIHALDQVPLRYQPSFDRSYDVCWALPGYQFVGTEPGGQMQVTGVVTKVMKTRVKFLNVCPETIYVRLQRPLGYEADPLALAMWEPMRNKDLFVILKPHTSQSFVLENKVPAGMAPKQMVCNGCLCMHLLSYTSYREPVSDMGVDLVNPSATLSAFEMQFTVEYECNNGEVGVDSSRFCYKVYTHAQRMDLVNVGPVVPVRFYDLRLDNRSVMFGSLGQGTKHQAMTFVATDQTTTDTQAIGLDPGTVYLLPQNFRAADTDLGSHLACLVFNAKDLDGVNDTNRWLMGYISSALGSTSKKYDYTLVLAASSSSLACVYPGNVSLLPLVSKGQLIATAVGRRSGFRVEGRPSPHFRYKGRDVPMVLGVRGAVRKSQTRFGACGYRYEDLTADQGTNVFLKTLTMITKVLKVGVQIAGALAMLAEPDRVEVGVSSTLSEYEEVSVVTNTVTVR